MYLLNILPIGKFPNERDFCLTNALEPERHFFEPFYKSDIF